MKRIFTLLCAAMLAGQAWADDNFKVGDLYYSTWFGKAYVECENDADNYANNYSGLTTVTIPDKVEYDGDEYPVVGISREAFKNCTSLTTITFPNSLQQIEEAAFYGCSNLKSVVIPNSETNLRESIFQNCTSLESVTLPSSITEIPSAIFGGCTSLTTIEIPNTVTFIGNGAFSGSGLTSIEIPASVTEIASFAFQDCDGLETITIPATVEKVQSWVFRGCDNLTINCCVTSIPTTWSTYWNDNVDFNLGSCGGEQTWTVTVSANNSSYGSVSGGGTYANGSTVTITATPADSYKFVKWSNGLTSTTANIIVTSDTTIVAEFAEMSLQYEVTSSNTVQVVHSEDYKNLTEIVIPETVVINGKTYTVTSIGYEAFYNCNQITSVVIPNTITSIGTSAFDGCAKLKAVTIPNSVDMLGWYVFYRCSSLTGINVESGNNSFSSENGVVFSKDKKTLVFYPCGKKDASYSIPESVTRIGPESFSGNKNLKSVIIPNSVKIIGDGAFRHCDNLMTIDIPNSVTTIENNAFIECVGLTTVSISESVANIGSGVFCYCAKLTEINVVDDNPKYSSENGVLFSKNKDTIICYPAGKTATIYSIPETVTNIGSAAFDQCKLKAITIPESVTHIGVQAFRDSDLRLVAIPESVRYIGDDAFSDCDKLVFNKFDNAYYLGSADNPYFALIEVISRDVTSCEINSDCKIIADNAFYDCDELTSISIPESVTNIGSDAFYGCDNLQYNEYDNALYWGNDENKYIILVKAKSTHITSCEINSGCRIIANSAFDNCMNLLSISIPESVNTIGDRAFADCFGLTTVSIPKSVTSIGKLAFYDCCWLGVITIPESVTTIADKVFLDNNSLTIYCGAGSQPKGWSDIWNPDNRPVVWDAGSDLRLFIAKGAANNVGFGKVDGGGAVVSGFTTKFSANPAEGYHFISWSDGNTDNPRTLTVTSDTVLTALFEAHTIVVDVAVPATRTETGLTEGSHCSVCGKVIVAQEIIPMLNATAVTETAANAANIYAHGNTIVVENATDEISVYDAMGRLVCRDAARHVSTVAESGIRAELQVSGAGVYIVKVGAVAKRVMVND